MNKYLKRGFAATAFCATACATLLATTGTALAGPDDAASKAANNAAGETRISETRVIDARVVRVKLDGVIDLKLRQGAVPLLVLSGDRRTLDKTTTVQDGDTISIGTDIGGFNVKLGRHRGVRAELTLPRLREVASESVGTTEILGFTGDALDLGLDGAGSMKVVSNYRIVVATLGGVGSMHIQGADGEGIDLNLRGAGYVTLSGRSRWLKASLGGLGGLDARHLQADTVKLELSGLGNASVTALQDASLNLSGLGSVTVYGKPASRDVSVDGLGKVSWK